MPLPVPLAPLVIVSHAALLVAVHAQVEVTATEPAPPAATSGRVAGDTDDVQGGAEPAPCATVKVWPATSSLVLRAAPVTLALAAGAALLWLGAGLAAGVLAARAGGGVDQAVTAFGLLGISVPVFWLGEMVNLLTQGVVAWVPPLGARPDSLGGWLRTLALPCATLALLYAGVYARVLRTSLRDAYRQDYIRTARAKGLSEGRVLGHAIRNALVPVLALFGLDFGALVGGGTVLVEVAFGLRGVGKLTADALQSLDLAMVMAAVLYAAVFVVLSSAAVDALQAALDPRQR